MAKEYEVKMHSDGRIIVILHEECNISREEILSLIREAGLDLQRVIFLTPEDALSCETLENASVIIPLDSETCNAADLESAAQHCVNAGARIIAVFGPGFSYTALHPIADKYGTQCGWSSSALSSRIVESNTDHPLDSTDSKLKRADSKQVIC